MANYEEIIKRQKLYIQFGNTDFERNSAQLAWGLTAISSRRDDKIFSLLQFYQLSEHERTGLPWKKLTNFF